MDLLSMIIASRKRVDPDAADYFARIEEAGSSINFNNRNAVNQFIVGCKEDGIWNAIKASCILAGADTLSGALVPLVGDAPTNFNFEDADYSVTTGLIGDGSTKYLSSNRSGSADLQNAFHLSFWSHTATASGVVMGSGGASLGASMITRGAAVNYPFRSRIAVFNVAAQGTRSTVSITGMVGHSRSASGSFISRISGSNQTITSTSASALNQDIFVFARNNTGTADAFVAERLMFYSIGSNLNLALLDARLTALMASLRPTVDPDALAYFARIEAAGSTINADNKNAINQFIIGCKEDGNWTSIKASCILAGADTLSGALVPLVGTAPTNFNFVDSDYSRTTGLVGNGTTKRIDSNRNNNSDPQNSHHLAAWVTTTDTTSLNNPGLIGTGGFAEGESVIGYSLTAGVYFLRSRSSSSFDGSAAVRDIGFHGISRTSSTNINCIIPGIPTSVTTLISQTPRSSTIKVFGRDVTPYWNGRISFYSIGESINLALLNTRLAKLMRSLT